MLIFIRIAYFAKSSNKNQFPVVLEMNIICESSKSRTVQLFVSVSKATVVLEALVNIEGKS